MKTGKLYKLNKVEGLEWIFIWDHPYSGNHAIDKLPIGKPYMFLGHEPGMICLVLEKVVWGRETYCKILVGDQVYYMHHSLYNQTNFQVVRAEAA